MCNFSTSQLPKVVQTCSVLYMLTSKCASRHNSVHFFNISTSKSYLNVVCFVHFDFEMCFAPQRRVLLSVLNVVCFVHFDFEMCLAPQRRALFQHLNFQKSGPRPSVFNTFDFEMCFAPQRRALFRHLNFQKWSAPHPPH